MSTMVAPLQTPSGDTDTVEVILQRGGDVLRGRMAAIERDLQRVTREAGVPLAAYASSTICSGGKRLRPLLVVLAAQATEQTVGDGTVREDALVRCGVAVELVHSATLVHDDVIDGARLRRGHPTVAHVAGREIAVATGDLLFSTAFAQLAGNGDPMQLRALSDATSSLAAGELAQREDCYARDVPVERYLRRCELKTAALFEAACRLGALAALGESTELADLLGGFARRIGLAFQLLDDVLDVSGPVERTGKARGTDLLDGTVTLPLILARERDGYLASLDLAALGGPAEAEALCDRIAATGALAEARERALGLVETAKQILPAALPEGRSALLSLVADAVVERYR